LDEATAQLLENCEANLVVAATLFKSGNVTEAEPGRSIRPRGLPGLRRNQAEPK
jgi:hypothetical protein